MEVIIKIRPIKIFLFSQKNLRNFAQEIYLIFDADVVLGFLKIFLISMM
jgi:hypothetical protein